MLIFNKLPKPDPTVLLDVGALMEEGRTLTYEELPAALWATTGYRIPRLDRFKDFGKLRNVITHLAVPGGTKLDEEIYKFLFYVLEPAVYDFWKADIIECYEWFGEEEQYVTENLKRYKIRFRRRTKRKG